MQESKYNIDVCVVLSTGLRFIELSMGSVGLQVGNGSNQIKRGINLLVTYHELACSMQGCIKIGKRESLCFRDTCFILVLELRSFKLSVSRVDMQEKRYF